MDAHVLFDIGVFTRVVIGMVSAWRQTWTVKHQIRTVFADQDGSRLGLVKFTTLHHVSIATGRRRARYVARSLLYR